ncbi:MAG: hypothetical protein WDM81_03250 [Rhizomicrobium sp.]
MEQNRLGCDPNIPYGLLTGRGVAYMPFDDYRFTNRPNGKILRLLKKYARRNLKAVAKLRLQLDGFARQSPRMLNASTIRPAASKSSTFRRGSTDRNDGAMFALVRVDHARNTVCLGHVSEPDKPPPFADEFARLIQTALAYPENDE